MPIHKDIEAGAYDPEEAGEVTAESLLAAVDAAQTLVDEISAQRHKIRDTTGKRHVLEALAETDQPHVDAIAALNASNRELGRFLGSSPGQSVEVGTASDSEMVIGEDDVEEVEL